MRGKGLCAKCGTSVCGGCAWFMTSITQKIAYKPILSQKEHKETTRPHTLANLHMTRETIYNLGGNCPTNERLWYTISLNWRDLSINVRTFLWKLLHSAHQCRTNWSKIINYEERGISSNCDIVKKMNHILFECTSNQGTLIWKTAREICKRKHICQGKALFWCSWGQ